MKTTKTITKDFSYRGKHYVIVYNHEHNVYMTIDYKFINEQGTTTRPLYYADGLHTNKTLNGCIEDTKRDLDIEYYEGIGMSKTDAFCKAFNITDALGIEEVRKIFNE